MIKTILNVFSNYAIFAEKINYLNKLRTLLKCQIIYVQDVII